MSRWGSVHATDALSDIFLLGSVLIQGRGVKWIALLSQTSVDGDRKKTTRFGPK